MFDKNLFYEFFHIERKEDTDTDFNQEKTTTEDQHSFPIIIDCESPPSDVLTYEEKFKLLTTELNDLRDILMHHGTTQLKDYLFEIEVLKKHYICQTIENSNQGH